MYRQRLKNGIGREASPDARLQRRHNLCIVERVAERSTTAEVLSGQPRGHATPGFRRINHNGRQTERFHIAGKLRRDEMNVGSGCCINCF